jgi:methylase of polypeptide subunit release factors
MPLAAVDRLPSLTDAFCARLIARFQSAGFTPELIADAERFAPGLLLAPRLPLLRWWLARRPEAGARLARLFKYDEPLAAGEATDALGADLASALTDAGILAPGPDGATVVSRFMITPSAPQLWLLSDALDGGRDAVMGPGGGTEHLARLIPQRFSGAALDVGCGAGSFALVAARAGARRAAGVDINPRAVEIARFNARLNALPAEFRSGDGVAPVAGEAFDLVVSQPPFVVRPAGEAERTFLFGGADGDELPQRLLREIASVLAPGGRALVLLQSPARDELPLANRMRAALAGAPVDLLTIGAKAPALAAQASVFASFEDPALGAGYAAASRRYLDHFAARGIRRFEGALVVVGRRADDSRDPPGQPPRRYTIGIQVAHAEYDLSTLERYLRGLDLLALPPEELDRACLRVSPYASVSDGAEAEPAADDRRLIRVGAPGIGADWRAGPSQLALLQAVDDAPSVGAALNGLAATPGLAAGSRDSLLATAREALIHGVLERAS